MSVWLPREHWRPLLFSSRNIVEEHTLVLAVILLVDFFRGSLFWLAQGRCNHRIIKSWIQRGPIVFDYFLHGKIVSTAWLLIHVLIIVNLLHGIFPYFLEFFDGCHFVVSFENAVGGLLMITIFKRLIGIKENDSVVFNSGAFPENSSLLQVSEILSLCFIPYFVYILHPTWTQWWGFSVHQLVW